MSSNDVDKKWHRCSFHYLKKTAVKKLKIYSFFLEVHVQTKFQHSESEGELDTAASHFATMYF